MLPYVLVARPVRHDGVPAIRSSLVRKTNAAASRSQLFLCRRRTPLRDLSDDRLLSKTCVDLHVVAEGNKFFIAAKGGLSPAILKTQFLKAFFAPVEGQTLMLGEGSVSTIYSADALKRAQASFPDAKFIVMLREPVALMRSYHARLLYMRQETEQDFETTWNLQDARAAGRNIPRSCYDPRMLQYREVGSLGRYTSQMFDLLGRENCHPILFDDFTKDTLTTYRKTLEFLGLPDDGRIKFKKKNSHAGFKSAFMQDIYSGAILGPLGRVMAKQPRHLARVAALTRPMRRKFRARNQVELTVEPFDTALADMLRAYFKEDVELLSTLLQRDLSHWLLPRPPLSPAKLAV